MIQVRTSWLVGLIMIGASAGAVAIATLVIAFKVLAVAAC